ncbi:hypothetical protein Bpfe_004008, partial [Biomphalaria pfeifferi]
KMAGQKKPKRNRSKAKNHSSKKRDQEKEVAYTTPRDIVVLDDTVRHLNDLSISNYSTPVATSTSNQISNDIESRLHSGPLQTLTASTSGAERGVTNRKNKKTKHHPCSQRTEVTVYDASFAKQQVVRHFGICVVCHKLGYFLKPCSRCLEAKCCSNECLGAHCIKDDQRVICIRNVLFTNARKYIPLALKENMFNKGIAEISSHLYSIPKTEEFTMMGGSRRAVLLQVLTQSIVDFIIIQLVVQDSDGRQTKLNIHPPPNTPLESLGAWFNQMDTLLPSGTFLLLFAVHWNNHVNAASAAVDIVSPQQQLRVIPDTKHIFSSITKKDVEAVNRASLKSSLEGPQRLPKSSKLKETSLTTSLSITAPHYSTTLQHHITAPHYSTTLQHHITAPHYSTTLQHHITAPHYSTTLQHHITAPHYSTTLQHHITAPHYSTTLQPNFNMNCRIFKCNLV